MQRLQSPLPYSGLVQQSNGEHILRAHTYICTHLKQNIIKIQSCAYSLRSLRAAVNQPPSSFLVVIQHFLIAVGFWSILINCVGGASARADGSNLKIFLCQSFGSRKHQKLQTQRDSTDISEDSCIDSFGSEESCLDTCLTFAVNKSWLVSQAVTLMTHQLFHAGVKDQNNFLKGFNWHTSSDVQIWFWSSPKS